MGGFDQIATTGSPAIVTALGMGTVFLCLALLYLMTRLLAQSISRLLASTRGTPADEAAASTTAHEAEGVPAALDASAPEKEGVAAAIAIALTRHRSSRTRAGTEEAKGSSAWKMAGRMRAFRDS
jgi:sodium pump decarboxylase gamma subunit